MIINLNLLPYLSSGAALLGSGGGQNPQVLLKSVEQALAESGNVTLIDVESLDDDALVVPVEYMGAPDPNLPLHLEGRELEKLIKRVESRFGKKVDAILTGEIGGANGLVGVLIAARLQLPLIDGDNVGRALPMLQMNTPSLAGIKPTPAFLGAKDGEIILEIDTPDLQSLENICRAVAKNFDGNAAFIYNVMRGYEAKKAIAKNTISEALRLGKEMADGKNIGKLLTKGQIAKVELERESGFLKGSIEIVDEETVFVIDVCNEFMKVKKNGMLIASVPEIITMLNDEGKIITSEVAKIGMGVNIFCLDAPPMWLEKAGLSLLKEAGF